MISIGRVKLIPRIRSPMFAWSAVEVRMEPKGEYELPSNWYQLDGAEGGFPFGHGV